MDAKRELIFLQPVLKERIWGGSRLRTEWGYESDLQGALGECWAVSCNEQADSVVTEGSFRGRRLSQLWQEQPELFGDSAGADFPLLVKIIDAGTDLSVQVHPGDAYAAAHGRRQGKWECWYILDCPESAELIVGSRARSREELARRVAKGEWASLLNRVPVRRGDFLRVDPGTLHAITAGVELLEVQQNSDVTYRIYDYDRLQNGRPRELHLQEGLEVTRVPYCITQEDVIHTEDAENVWQVLADTAQYRMQVCRVNGGAAVPTPAGNTFQIGSVLEGSGTIDGKEVRKGMHFIIPAGNGPKRAEGTMRISLVAPAVTK